MAVTVNTTKYFYPPRPGSGAATFSDNIVGLQTVQGGGLTQGNFEFTTGITEKVNRKFNVGAFSEPVNLSDLDIDDLTQSRRIQATQFRVYPNYDVSQVLNFSMYGSLAKRFQVSVTLIFKLLLCYKLDISWYVVTTSLYILSDIHVCIAVS